MNLKPVIKGVTLGATVGTMVYVVSKSSPRQKRELRKNTGKALKAFSTVVDGFTSMIN